MAAFALGEKIRKILEMPARLPHFRVHNDGSIHGYHITALGHKKFPPSLLDVLFEQMSQRAVIPTIRKPTINFAPRKHKPAPFAERDNSVHFIGFDHIIRLLSPSLSPPLFFESHRCKLSPVFRVLLASGIFRLR